MQSWKDIPADSDFSIYNIPFGIISTGESDMRIASRIGDEVIDLKAAHIYGLFDGLGLESGDFIGKSLNKFIKRGKQVTNAVRLRLQKALSDESSPLRKAQDVFLPVSKVKVHMPIEVGDYTDFYSSIEHATNVGMMFRDPENALLPNWKHLPVGYHGRASSIIESGVNIKRPSGQTKPPEGAPVFGPSQRLDFELEMAFIIGKETEMGSPITTANAEEHIFGMVLFNDWSARDIQKWEYVPLGPFLGKNFASSVSVWVVTLEALEHFRLQGPSQDPAVLPYLQYEGQKNYDINLEVSITPDGGKENIVSRSNFKFMYWNMCQQLAHHTVNGCNVRVGDMLASGTISGKDESSYGSMLEISWAGKKPVTLNDGSQRKFINDGDTVTMKGFGNKDGVRVGFGEVSSKVIPAE